MICRETGDSCSLFDLSLPTLRKPILLNLISSWSSRVLVCPVENRKTYMIYIYIDLYASFILKIGDHHAQAQVSGKDIFETLINHEITFPMLLPQGSSKITNPNKQCIRRFSGNGTLKIAIDLYQLCFPHFMGPMTPVPPSWDRKLGDLKAMVIHIMPMTKSCLVT